MYTQSSITRLYITPLCLKIKRRESVRLVVALLSYIFVRLLSFFLCPIKHIRSICAILGSNASREVKLELFQISTKDDEYSTEQKSKSVGIITTKYHNKTQPAERYIWYFSL